jgi:hypothetical protein
MARGGARSQREIATAKFDKSELYARATLRVAMHIRGLWEERGASDTRLLEGFFIPDVFTVVGKSHAFDGVGHREHVVPRRVVLLECHRMLADGANDAAIAELIRDHVKIVLITRDECARLDQRTQLGLRQVMPASWKFGDDIFARLAAAKIGWSPAEQS